MNRYRYANSEDLNGPQHHVDERDGGMLVRTLITFFSLLQWPGMSKRIKISPSSTSTLILCDMGVLVSVRLKTDSKIFSHEEIIIFK